MRAIALQFAAADHSHRDGEYLRSVRQLRRRCEPISLGDLRSLATAGYDTLTSHRVTGASYLSEMHSLAAGVAPKGPPVSCSKALTAYTTEATGPPPSGHGFAGYAATTPAWAAAHHVDRAHADGYLPRLPDGDDSFVIGGDGRVTALTRNFDPPVSQAVALSSIRRGVLPGHLQSVYSLVASNCHEQIYLSPMLGSLLSSSSLGVMIELTSGHGISSRYDSTLVTRALLSIGGRIGGQPCV
jgi:hypothetical protein